MTAFYPKQGEVISVGGTEWRITAVRKAPNGHIDLYEVVDAATGHLPNAFGRDEVKTATYAEAYRFGPNTGNPKPRLKVWGGHLHIGDAKGQRRAIVATRTKAEAAKAFGVSMYWLNLYGSQTGNAEEIAVATAEPGVVFHRHIDDRDGAWER